MTRKALEKQSSDKGTLGSLLTSLEQAVEAKRQNDEAIANIRESLSGRIEEMQQEKTMVEKVMGVSDVPLPLPKPSWSFPLRKEMIYWLAIFVLLQVLVIVWYQGFSNPDTVKPVPPSSDDLVMMAVQAKLTKQAIELVREDVVQGRLRSTELTIQALSAELPEVVRERVLKSLGEPEMDFMRDALDILEGKLSQRNNHGILFGSRSHRDHRNRPAVLRRMHGKCHPIHRCVGEPRRQHENHGVGLRMGEIPEAPCRTHRVRGMG